MKVAFHLRALWAVRAPLRKACRRVLAPSTTQHEPAGSKQNATTYASKCADIFYRMGTTAKEGSRTGSSPSMLEDGKKEEEEEEEQQQHHQQQEYEYEYEYEYDDASATAWLHSRAYLRHPGPPSAWANNPFRVAEQQCPDTQYRCPIADALISGDIALARYLFRLRLRFERESDYLVEKRARTGFTYGGSGNGSRSGSKGSSDRGSKMTEDFLTGGSDDDDDDDDDVDDDAAAAAADNDNDNDNDYYTFDETTTDKLRTDGQALVQRRPRTPRAVWGPQWALRDECLAVAPRLRWQVVAADNPAPPPPPQPQPGTFAHWIPTQRARDLANPPDLSEWKRKFFFLARTKIANES